MLNDDSDDLSYNPFAEPEDDYSPTGGSNLAQGYYSSAFFPKLSHSQPTLRRRRSSSNDYARAKPNGELRKHTRTRTEIQIDVPPQSAGLHPLKSALARVDDSSYEDLGITRPHLSRIINEGSSAEVPVSDDNIKRPPSPEEEKDVIIHQVSQKDSLPGVALKYGISLPNLRRANKLWPSDPIHHRAVLYIPVEQASRAREYIPELNLIDLNTDPQDKTANIIAATSASPSLKRENSGSVPPSPTAGTVRRIPAKQLSYFPPSSHKSIDPPPSTPPRILSSPASKALPNRYTSSPASNSLTSILTALPIAASTRDEIITRLSFDSVSSSFSDRSRINSDEDDGHELNEVKRPSPITIDDSDSEEIDDTQPTPKAAQRISHAMRPQTELSAPSISKSTQSRPQPHLSTSPPHFYVSQAHETHVRTSQLEPSPAMKLPAFSSRTVGRTAGKPVQAGGRLERTGSLTLGRKSKIATPDDIVLALDNLTTNAPR
ncbi:hypothetical protein BDN70DRAFT_801886 [Pholiota conissans]|uniref:LysM domain-containing protein n=1 Tax=Pholiota conissans TaxID=109636 RepID=A0A9P6CVV8_9AGAR|nr:hypothetical protein BDN70DRAFT_801886 [Pholiota conissans]